MLQRLCLLLVLTLVTASAAIAAPAKLTVLPGSQIAVRGTTFHPGENVVLVVAAGGDHASKRVTAGPAGGFVARFPTVEVGSCTVFSVRATGDLGSHAVVTVRPPECPQPMSP